MLDCIFIINTEPMIKYALKHKNGEVINTTSANDLNEAAENFAKLKRITSNQLLEIFVVEIFVR
jgi:hypothetical protein